MTFPKGNLTFFTPLLAPRKNVSFKKRGCMRREKLQIYLVGKRFVNVINNLNKLSETLNANGIFLSH